MAATTKTPAAKAAPTPRRKAASSGNQDRPVKPTFHINEAEGVMHYSPDGEIDIAVSIDPPWKLVEPIVVQSADGTQADLFNGVMELLYGDDAAVQAAIGELRTTQFFALVYRWVEEFQKNMGLESLGES